MELDYARVQEAKVVPERGNPQYISALIFGLHSIIPPYADVICHFIDANKQLRTILLAVRHIYGDHSGRNQARPDISWFRGVLFEGEVGLLHYR